MSQKGEKKKEIEDKKEEETPTTRKNLGANQSSDIKKPGLSEKELKELIDLTGGNPRENDTGQGEGDPARPANSPEVAVRKGELFPIFNIPDEQLVKLSPLKRFSYVNWPTFIIKVLIVLAGVAAAIVGMFGVLS